MLSNIKGWSILFVGIWCVESISLNKLFLIINSFIFDNNVNDVFDVGTIFVLIVFVVDLVMESEVWRREDDLIMDEVESWHRGDNLDMEGVETVCESIMLK